MKNQLLKFVLAIFLLGVGKCFSQTAVCAYTTCPPIKGFQSSDAMQNYAMLNAIRLAIISGPTSFTGTLNFKDNNADTLNNILRRGLTFTDPTPGGNNFSYLYRIKLGVDTTNSLIRAGNTTATNSFNKLVSILSQLQSTLTVAGTVTAVPSGTQNVNVTNTVSTSEVTNSKLSLNSDTIVRRGLIRSITFTAQSQSTVNYSAGQTITESGKTTSYSLAIPTDGYYKLDYVIQNNNNTVHNIKVMLSYSAVTTGSNYATFNPTSGSDTFIGCAMPTTALFGGGTYAVGGGFCNASASTMFSQPIYGLIGGVLYVSFVANASITPITNEVFIFRFFFSKL